MKKIFLTLIAFTTIFSVFGQRDETFLSNPSLKLTGVWFSSSFSTPHIVTKNPDAVGEIFALEFNKDYLVGGENMDWHTETNSLGEVDITAKSLFVGYAHDGFKVIHPTVGFSIGRARVEADGHVPLKTTTSLASVGAEFNVFRWFRLGGEVGYRHIVTPENTWLESTDFSGPYAAIRLKFGWSWGR